jgi:hypothetical protein
MHNTNQTRVSFLNGGFVFRRYSKGALQLESRSMAAQTDNPEFWRYRAEEVRTITDGMKNAEAKTIMNRIAEDYERIARLFETGPLKR